jgi:NTP pyrophosphatase (non-canonical NTP hydrolase)
MDLKQYSFRALKTAKYPKEKAIEYTTLGLVSEAGEVAGKVKKIIRDSDGIFDEKKKLEIADEVGDVLWYCATLCHELGIDIGTVAIRNLAKLESRHERGVIGGSGDNR